MTGEEIFELKNEKSQSTTTKSKPHIKHELNLILNLTALTGDKKEMIGEEMTATPASTLMRTTRR